MARARPSISDPNAARQRRIQALEEALDVRLRPGSSYLWLEVSNPTNRSRHQVLRPGGADRPEVFCDCTDFGRRGLGTCKHAEAASLWLGEHPDARPVPAPFDGGPLWSAIDRGIEARRRSGRLGPRELRRPGEVLREPGSLPRSGPGSPSSAGSDRDPISSTCPGRP